jgi:glycosyltransferase involved in cell wall biosynthesis
VYLTYPFVLSWSLLEAMSAGCLVVGSRTPPVEEVVRDGENGLLTDFFSAEEIAARVDQALSMDAKRIRERARMTVLERYDLKRVCLPAQLGLVERLLREKLDGGEGGVRVQDVDALEANTQARGRTDERVPGGGRVAL